MMYSFYCFDCDGTIQLEVDYQDRNHQDCPACDNTLLWLDDSQVH